MTSEIPDTATILLKTLATDYPAEVSSLLKLAPAAAADILRQVVLENPGLGAEDAAARIAEKLRSLNGLSGCETETVTAPLTRRESDQFDAICATIV